MFEACVALEAEYVEAEAKLADPAIHADQNAARRLGKRHARSEEHTSELQSH